MIQISLRHTADSQCWRLEPEPLTCPGWAAGRSIGTTVWRRRYTRQEQRVLQLCCRHSWRGGAACHRRTGGSEHHGLWWCHPPGCSRQQSANNRGPRTDPCGMQTSSFTTACRQRLWNWSYDRMAHSIIIIIIVRWLGAYQSYEKYQITCLCVLGNKTSTVMLTNKSSNRKCMIV